VKLQVFDKFQRRGEGQNGALRPFTLVRTRTAALHWMDRMAAVVVFEKRERVSSWEISSTTRTLAGRCA